MKKSPRAPRLAAGKGCTQPSSPLTPVRKATVGQGTASSAGRGAAAPQPSRDVCPVVGIGASAGGLEAFSELLSHLPVDAPLALVFVQHLDPKHPSILTDILSRVTRIPVVEVKHGMRVEPGHVYVMPAEHAHDHRRRGLEPGAEVGRSGTAHADRSLSALARRGP